MERSFSLSVLCSQVGMGLTFASTANRKTTGNNVETMSIMATTVTMAATRTTMNGVG